MGTVVRSPCIDCPKWGTPGWEELCVPTCRERLKYAEFVSKLRFPTETKRMEEVTEAVTRGDIKPMNPPVAKVDVEPEPDAESPPEIMMNPATLNNVMDAIKMLLEETPGGVRKVDVFRLMSNTNTPVHNNGVTDPQYSIISRTIDRLTEEGLLIKKRNKFQTIYTIRAQELPPKGKTLYAVTARHSQIRKLWRQGKDVKEIVEVMNVSKSTVNEALRKIKPRRKFTKKLKAKAKKLPEAIQPACGVFVQCACPAGGHLCELVKGHVGDHKAECQVPPAKKAAPGRYLNLALKARKKLKGDTMEFKEFKPSIYLAGRVDGNKHHLIAPFKNMFYWLCSDGGNHSEHNFGFGYCCLEDRHREIKHLVEESAVNVIKDCSAMVAYVDSPHCYGTIAEVAFASALNIPIYLIVNETVEGSREAYDMADAYWFVSCFPGVKLYVTGCLCSSLMKMTEIVMELAHKYNVKCDAVEINDRVKDALFSLFLSKHSGLAQLMAMVETAKKTMPGLTQQGFSK